MEKALKNWGNQQWLSLVDDYKLRSGELNRYVLIEERSSQIKILTKDLFWILFNERNKMFDLLSLKYGIGLSYLRNY